MCVISKKKKREKKRPRKTRVFSNCEEEEERGYQSKRGQESKEIRNK
jgi:hypothetical protein